MAEGRKFPVIFTLGAQDGASAKFAQAVRKMRAEARKLTSIGKAMTVGVTLPILGMGAAAVKMATDFHSGMSNVNTLIDSNKESLDAMGKSVLDIGKRTPVAISDLTEALYTVRSAGVAAADQFKVLEGSAQLAVAGRGSTNEAVDLATSSINSFGLKGAEAAAVYNTIFAAVQSGKMTISGLATGFGGVAKVAASTGTQLDEYLSSVVAMTLMGTPASQAHTRMAAVFAGLTRQTGKTREVFQALGAKDLPDLIQKSGGLVPALKKVSDQVGGNSTKILEMVGSNEALLAVQILTDKSSKSQENALRAMRTESNLVGDAFAKQANTTAAALQKSRNSVEATAISVGEKLAPTVTRLADGVATLTDKWASLSPGMQDAILIGAGLLAVMGPLTTVVGLSAGAYTWSAAAIVKYNVASKAAIIWTKGMAAAKWLWAAASGAATVATATLTTTMLPLLATAAPFLLLAAAIGSVAMAISQLIDLNTALEGSGGIMGTAMKMMEMGTLDPFAAHDSVMDDKAKADFDARQKAPKPAGPTAAPLPAATPIGGAEAARRGGPQPLDPSTLTAMAEKLATSAAIVVDFKNMPAGVLTSAESKGPGSVTARRGYANAGAL